MEIRRLEVTQLAAALILVYDFDYTVLLVKEAVVGVIADTSSFHCPI